MTPMEYAPPALAHTPAPIRFLVRHNPFYLLSAMCMLAGCLALTNSLSFSPIRLGRLLSLILTLNAYEALLLGLGLYLSVRRGLVRDGAMLLLLEALFLVDAAFLNVEVLAVDLSAGVVVNAALYALAVLKLGLVFRALRLPFGRAFALILAQLSVLFLLPGLFAQTSQGSGQLPESMVYAAWWLLGLLAAFQGIEAPTARPAPGAPRRTPGPLLAKALIVLPFLSLVLHLAMMHWVYKATFHGSYLSPLLLGLAVAAARATPSKFIGATELSMARGLLPIMAVLVAAVDQNALQWAPFASSRLRVTPVLLTAAGAYVAYVWIYQFRYLVHYLAAAAAAVLAVAFGPTPAQVGEAAQAAVRSAADLAWRVVPKTSTGWGVTGVVAAFAFLGIGAAISLKKGRPEEPAPEVAE